MKKTNYGKSAAGALPKLIMAIGRQNTLMVRKLIQRGRNTKNPFHRSNAPGITGGIKAPKLLSKPDGSVDAGFPNLPPVAANVLDAKLAEFQSVAGADSKPFGTDGKKASLPVGTTPLMVAAGHGNVEAIKQLLRARADINAQDEHGHNALFWALRWDKAEAARELLRQGSQITEDALCAPVRNGNAAMVALLIGKKANPNVLFRRFDGETTWPEGETLLGYAVTIAGILDYPMEIIQILVNGGADVNQPTRWFIANARGKVARQLGPVLPLEIACSRGLTEVAKLLRRAGAKKTTQDAVTTDLFGREIHRLSPAPAVVPVRRAEATGNRAYC